jgi:NAD-dependent dihydropyrimidine dehydrogenase PreA subunit
MCEFCLKHGEGQKWYLQANNYSEDLLNDVRRRKMIQNFAADGESVAKSIEKMDKLSTAPKFIQALVRRLVPRKMKKRHYGQVVPIEDVEKIFGFVNSIVRVACYCRHFTVGKEKRYCYGISMGPNGGKFGELMKNVDTSFLTGPDSASVETLTKEQAIASFREHEKEGLCHTVWTFQTPFIGGICNCDRADCLAMRCTVTHNVPVMFRAEFIAETDPDKCVGCRQCMKLCQFGAISYIASNKKAVVDKMKCYGCGICRAACAKDAIRLEPRANDPVAAKIW